MAEPLVQRYTGNPILTPGDIPYPVETVHNAGMAKYNGKYMMLFRSHRANGRSILGLAESDDGLRFVARSEPFMIPATEGVFAEYEAFGVEDARICQIDEGFLITYSAYSKHGVRIGLAKTHDFKSVERVALITQADLRNVVLFPARFGGRYARLDRPHSEISPWSIWLSYSPDLVHWGDSRVVMKPVQYHGAVYRLGVALHDLDDPADVVGVCDRWILQPEDPWEVTGYVHNVVFTCGAIPEEDGTVKIYWGGADKVMCVGTAVIDKLVDLCLTDTRPPM